ncbi:MAG: hypothetical protein KBS59_07305, partial [Clostridiales bacterium]|nr:hypothetical protein [Clostridiales bacterium]
LFENDGVAIGTYCDPIIGYNVEESSYYSIRNLFEIPEFKAHASLMEEYENAGFFGKSASGDFAVDVIHGDASVEVLYGDDYYVKVLQNPFVEESAVFDGMLAVSSYSSNATRALEFILELTTNPELKNLFQYGIEDVNYVVNDDETITRLNRDYIMNTGTTGNVYKGYPEEGMLANQWEYVKKTNLDSLPNPYLSYKAVTLGYACNYYVNDETLDGILAEVLTRACMDEAFAEFGYTYDEYLKNEGTIAGYRMGDVIKKAAKYKDYFISEIMKDSGSTLTQATNLYNASSQGSAKYPYSWYFTKLVEKMTAEKYTSLKTASSLNSAILEKIASLAGASLKDYDSAKTKAATYYGNIETLKIMARLVIWDGLDDDEWAYYDNMGAVEFETAVFNYVRDNYIEEYDLDDEKYDQLVKAFIVSQLKFTDPSDNSTYTITWDEYTEAKENAQDFIEVIDTLKETYHDRLVSYVGNQMLLSLYSDSDIPELVHDMLLSEWMNANGLKKNTYTTELYDEILSFMGITYSELTSTRKTDTTKFAEYMTKIKAQYKNVLIENFSMAQYKNGRISNDDVLTTLLNEKIEEKAGIYDAMCSELDITYSWYKSKLADMEKFVSYASQMRTKFTYTLLTVYSQSEIDNLSYNEIDSVVYGVISDSGFYMNELCSFICTDLGTYMTKKSDTKAYNTYIAKITSALKNELAAKGYTPEQVSTMNIPESSAILYDIVKEKYFSGITTIEQMLASVSGEYVKGVDTASDVGAYIDEAYDATKSNHLFTSIIYVLNTALEAALKTE